MCTAIPAPDVTPVTGVLRVRDGRITAWRVVNASPSNGRNLSTITAARLISVGGVSDDDRQMRRSRQGRSAMFGAVKVCRHVRVVTSGAASVSPKPQRAYRSRQRQPRAQSIGDNRQQHQAGRSHEIARCTSSHSNRRGRPTPRTREPWTPLGHPKREWSSSPVRISTSSAVGEAAGG